MMRSPLFKFKINRFVALVFWILIVAFLFIVYFYWPNVFYHVTESYQRTPYIQTP